MKTKKDSAKQIVSEPNKKGTKKKPLSKDLLNKMHAYWRAANYLSVGQLYLQDNPLLRKPLKLAHVKSVLLGHWGTTPGQNFVYVHLNRIIKEHDLDMIYISGPGHGGPALVGNTYLEGTYSEIYPDISQDEAGLKKLFTRFSFPEGYRAMFPPSARGRSTKVASWGTHSVMLSEQHSTIRSWLLPASLVTEKQRRGHWPRHGTPTNF